MFNSDQLVFVRITMDGFPPLGEPRDLCKVFVRITLCASIIAVVIIIILSYTLSGGEKQAENNTNVL